MAQKCIVWMYQIICYMLVCVYLLYKYFRCDLIRMLQIDKNKEIIEKITKLTTRIDIINSIKQTFIDFLLKNQQFYGSHSQKIKAQMENFQDSVSNKSFYSIGNCQDIKGFITSYRHFCVYIESVAKVNVADLKRIDLDMSRQQDNLKKKSQQFIKGIWVYSKDEQGYNTNFNSYYTDCNKLDQMMNKFKSYQDPINFYSLNMASDFTKKLDKKYLQCQNSQTSLASNLQILDQKRKLLSQNLKDIKQDYIALLHRHLINFENIAKCLVDMSKDQMYQNMKVTRISNGERSDMFNQEIQRFSDKYGKNKSNQDQLLNDLKELFVVQTSNVEISSDYKLFLDRCESFLKSKNQYVEETIFLQKTTYEEIEKQIEHCQRIQKQFWEIQKDIFKLNGIDNFKKRISKYFGEDILSICELCFYIADNPRKRYEKIGKIYSRYKQKLKKIIQVKQQQTKAFKKRTSIILAEHQSVRQTISSPDHLNMVSVNKFNTNVQKTFSNFKKIVLEFTRAEKQNDQAFNNQLSKITNQIKRQASHSLLGYILGKDRKQKQKVEFLKRINIDSEIISIVKNDARYQVLFNDPLKSNLFSEFKSSVQKNKFAETKKILQKRQYQERAVSSERVVGCCGLQSKKMPKYKVQSIHKGEIIGAKQNEKQKQQSSKKGIIQILNKGFMFQQKSKNPFSSKIVLMIPSKQIISIRNKIVRGQSGFQLLTNMGSLQFISQESMDIQSNLQKKLVTKINTRDDDSRRQKNSDTSSFLKQNNTSTQFKISVDSGFGNMKESHVKHPKNASTSYIYQQLSDKWLYKNFLSDKFISVQHQNPKTSVRYDYIFKDGVSKFLLKQKRQRQLSNTAKCLSLKYEWKVSFPELPMLKSFRHEQKITIEIVTNQVRISIVEKHRDQIHLFVRKLFFAEIDKMNKQFCDFVAKFCDKDADVKIQQEPGQGEQSTNLELQQFLQDPREEMYSKSSQRASRIIIDNEKFQAK